MIQNEEKIDIISTDEKDDEGSRMIDMPFDLFD